MNPIGAIHAPFKTTKSMPIQPAGAAWVKGTVEVFEEFQEGLKDEEARKKVKDRRADERFK